MEIKSSARSAVARVVQIHVIVVEIHVIGNFELERIIGTRQPERGKRNAYNHCLSEYAYVALAALFHVICAFCAHNVGFAVVHVAIDYVVVAVEHIARAVGGFNPHVHPVCIALFVCGDILRCRNAEIQILAVFRHFYALYIVSARFVYKVLAGVASVYG